MFLLTIYFLYMQLYEKKHISSTMISNTLSCELHSSKKYINSNIVTYIIFVISRLIFLIVIRRTLS